MHFKMKFINKNKICKIFRISYVFKAFAFRITNIKVWKHISLFYRNLCCLRSESFLSMFVFCLSSSFPSFIQEKMLLHSLCKYNF